MPMLLQRRARALRSTVKITDPSSETRIIMRHPRRPPSGRTSRFRPIRISPASTGERVVRVELLHPAVLVKVEQVNDEVEHGS
jgi:hypothetical protein